MYRFSSLAFALPLLAFPVAQASAGAPLVQEEDFAFEVGTEAYVYAYPMMMMEMTRRVSTNVKSPVGVFAPLN